MKRFGALLLSLCLFGAAGCGDDDSTSPSNLPIVMTASLSPANEVPAIANAENTGHGAVQITLNVTRDGNGAISGGTAEFHGGVIVNTGVVAGSPVTPSDGVMSFTSAAVSVPAALLQSIVNNPAGFYFNVHSPTNAGGVARGQLNRTQ